ncbi:MAG TPA: hypothetical protein VKH63_22265 [Candidatus Acidoferrum sp.]|nr:hypothetical protein [Candidatus Acidoferrum sp.]
MSLAAPPDHLHSLSGLEGRRSTRIDRTVPLVVLGQTKTGLSFQEKTSTVSFNLHGCRYPSRHEYPIGASVGLRVLQPDGETISPVIRAFVKSVHPPASPRELFQVGVELESPANIWNLSSPPPDWNRLLGGSASSAGLATAVAPALEPPAPPTAPAAFPSAASSSGSEARTSLVTEFPSPSPAAAGAPSAKESSPPKPERVAITIDQLVAAMQGKLQAAAEKVVQNALAEHLDEAIDAALARVEGVRERNLQQLGEFSEQRLESLMRSSREEILGHLESRLGEVQSRWEEQHNAFRTQAEEIVQRLEKLAADTQRNLAETQKFVDKATGEIVPQTRGRLDESLGQATEQFEAAADRISDRQLVRVMEATRMVTREAAAQMDARVAESRALLHSAAGSTLEEFRRQAEVQVDLAISETTERVRSALNALDAENRVACENRRRTMIDDVTRTTEQSTEQFRSGIKAFLYSCLVAAVGAVDEHAKTTLDGMVKEPGGTTRTIGDITDISDITKIPSDDEKPN